MDEVLITSSEDDDRATLTVAQFLFFQAQNARGSGDWSVNGSGRNDQLNMDVLSHKTSSILESCFKGNSSKESPVSSKLPPVSASMNQSIGIERYNICEDLKNEFLPRDSRDSPTAKLTVA
eukprot:scaffold13337_cov203-Alexandrium_tamarense.AAC.9